MKNTRSTPYADLFSALYEQFYRYSFAIALKSLKCEDKTADVCQEVFIRLHKTLEKNTEILNPKAWIARVTFNEVCRYINKNKRYIPGFDETLHVPKPKDEDNREQKIEFVRDLVQGVKNEKIKETIRLYYLEGFTADEVSKKQNVKLGTTLKRLHDFRTKVKEKLRDTENIDFIIILCLLAIKNY